MKLKIFGTADVPDNIVRLKLVQCGRDIQLVAVDEDGTPHHCGWILTIQDSGSICLSYGINPDLGFKLNPKTGQIETE